MKKTLERLVIATTTLAIISSYTTRALAEADRSTAFLTRSEGDVKIFTSPSEAAPKANPDGGPAIKFDGKFYIEKLAKRGAKVGPGELLKTGPDGKARIIFRNGDQVTVSENTAYRMTDQAGGKGALMEIIFGDARSIILPGGPRSGMKVITKSMSMGVRGTDFHVKAWSGSGGSEVTVIRGAVTVEKKSDVPTKAVELTAGQSAIVKAAAPAPAAKEPTTTGAVALPQVTEEIVVKQTSQQELVRIQQATTVAPAPKTEKESEETPDIAEMASLEAKAVENVMTDIKQHDPKAYEALQAKQSAGNGSPVDVDAINSVSVGKLFDQAPVDAALPKASKKDLKMKDDVYDQYNWKK